MSSVFDEAVRVYAYARTDVDMQVSMDKLGRARIEPKPPEVKAEPEDLAENLAGIEAAIGPMAAFAPDVQAAELTGEQYIADPEFIGQVAGLPKGMAEGTLGLFGDIYGLVAAAGKAGAYAQLKKIFPEEYPEQSLMVFAEEFGEISKSWGTEYFSDKFDGWLDKLPISEAVKEDIRVGSGIGQFFSIPGAGVATAAGVKGIKAGAKTVAGATQEFIEGAPARVAARKADTSVQLNAGVDVPAAIDDAIVGAQKLMGKTDEPQPLDINPETIDLTPEERSGSIIPQLYEGEEIAPPATGKRTIFDVANEIDTRTQTSGATPEMTPANKARIARVMAAETLHAMRKAGNAGDWYRTKVDNAMRIAQRVYPEAMEDPNKTQSLKFITAITSNGASVQDNAERTFQIFDDFLTSGRMPEKLEFGGGKERPAMEFGFKLYNDMVDEMGEDEFFDFLSQEFTVRELDEIGKQYGFKVSGENKDTLLPASVIFGPKIGGGFYQNLNGNYKPLTMDRWFMRSWGRYTGSLVVKQAEKTAQKQLERIRSEITPEIAQQFGYSHNELLADDDLLIELAQRAHKDYVRSGYKNKTELNKASKNFVEAQSKVLEAPGGGNQRNFMRDTVDEALDILRQQGVDLDRAALQALIWYPEKELYAKFGVGSKRSAPTDYETEFAKIANSRGVDVSDITGNANAEQIRRGFGI